MAYKWTMPEAQNLRKIDKEKIADGQLIKFKNRQ